MRLPQLKCCTQSAIGERRDCTNKSEELPLNEPSEFRSQRKKGKKDDVNWAHDVKNKSINIFLFLSPQKFLHSFFAARFSRISLEFSSEKKCGDDLSFVKKAVMRHGF